MKLRALHIEDSADDAELVRCALDEGEFKIEMQRVETEQEMLAALAREMPGQGEADPDNRVVWNTPQGGMFLWARLPRGMDAVALLGKAVDKGVAFVPGLAFFADHPDPRCLRLSFVTPSVEEIERGVAALAAAVRESIAVVA